MAAGEGFETSHTESESAVLPLHNPAVFLTNKYHYTHFREFVNTKFHIFPKNEGRLRPLSRSRPLLITSLNPMP